MPLIKKLAIFNLLFGALFCFGLFFIAGELEVQAQADAGYDFVITGHRLLIGDEAKTASQVIPIDPNEFPTNLILSNNSGSESDSNYGFNPIYASTSTENAGECLKCSSSDSSCSGHYCRINSEDGLAYCKPCALTKEQIETIIEDLKNKKVAIEYYRPEPTKNTYNVDTDGENGDDTPVCQAICNTIVSNPCQCDNYKIWNYSAAPFEFHDHWPGQPYLFRGSDLNSSSPTYSIYGAYENLPYFKLAAKSDIPGDNVPDTVCYYIDIKRVSKNQQKKLCAIGLPNMSGYDYATHAIWPIPKPNPGYLNFLYRDLKLPLHSGHYNWGEDYCNYCQYLPAGDSGIWWITNEDGKDEGGKDKETFTICYKNSEKIIPYDLYTSSFTAQFVYSAVVFYGDDKIKFAPPYDSTNPDNPDNYEFGDGSMPDKYKNLKFYSSQAPDPAFNDKKMIDHYRFFVFPQENQPKYPPAPVDLVGGFSAKMEFPDSGTDKDIKRWFSYRKGYPENSDPYAYSDWYANVSQTYRLKSSADSADIDEIIFTKLYPWIYLDQLFGITRYGNVGYLGNKDGVLGHEVNSALGLSQEMNFTGKTYFIELTCRTKKFLEDLKAGLFPFSPTDIRKIDGGKIEKCPSYYQCTNNSAPGANEYTKLREGDVKCEDKNNNGDFSDEEDCSNFCLYLTKDNEITSSVLNIPLQTAGIYYASARPEPQDEIICSVDPDTKVFLPSYTTVGHYVTNFDISSLTKDILTDYGYATESGDPREMKLFSVYNSRWAFFSQPSTHVLQNPSDQSILSRENEFEDGNLISVIENPGLKQWYWNKDTTKDRITVDTKWIRIYNSGFMFASTGGVTDLEFYFNLGNCGSTDVNFDELYVMAEFFDGVEDKNAAWLLDNGKDIRKDIKFDRTIREECPFGSSVEDCSGLGGDPSNLLTSKVFKMTDQDAYGNPLCKKIEIETTLEGKVEIKPGSEENLTYSDGSPKSISPGIDYEIAGQNKIICRWPGINVFPLMERNGLNKPYTLRVYGFIKEEPDDRLRLATVNTYSSQIHPILLPAKIIYADDEKTSSVYERTFDPSVSQDPPVDNICAFEDIHLWNPAASTALGDQGKITYGIKIIDQTPGSTADFPLDDQNIDLKGAKFRRLDPPEEGFILEGLPMSEIAKLRLKYCHNQSNWGDNPDAHFVKISAAAIGFTYDISDEVTVKFVCEGNTCLATPLLNVFGYAWSDTFGWLDMTCRNTSPKDPNCGGNLWGTGIDYKTGKFSGYAWSENLGWICFGETCPGEPPDGGDLENKNSWAIYQGGEDPTNARNANYGTTEVPNENKVVTGWARILSLANYGKKEYDRDDWGWIKLAECKPDADANCDDRKLYDGYFNVSNPGENLRSWIQLDLEKRQMQGWAWSGNGSDRAGSNLDNTGMGWISFNYGNLQVGEISGVVYEDTYPEGGNGIFDLDLDKPIKAADVRTFSAEGTLEYATFTNDMGQYNLLGLPVPPEDKQAEYSVEAVAGGYELGQKTGINLTSEKPVVSNQNISLSKLSEGNYLSRIQGVVYEEINETPGFQEGNDRNIPWATVYIEGVASTISDGFGNYVLKVSDEEGSYDYDINAVALGYQKGRTGISFTVNDPPGYNIYGDDSGENADIALKPLGYAVGVGLPWLQTLWGDIHSLKKVGEYFTPRPPLGFGNATYLISAGDRIRQFVSWKQLYQPYTEWTPEMYTLPQEIALAEIDIGRLEQQAKGEGHQLDESKTSLTPDDISGEGVWYKNGDLTLEGGSWGEGAKTIVVDGDLTIAGQTSYKTGSFKRENLPVVGFVVTGKIIFEEEVSQAVGAFYSESKIETKGDLGFLRLEIKGLMVAREFKLQRCLAGLCDMSKPSEKVTYDGRLSLNPPPGFEDLSIALPFFKEVRPR